MEVNTIMINFNKYTEKSHPEVIEFYKKFDKDEIKQMEKAAKKKDWDAFKQIIQYGAIITVKC